jgi:hypothetical protein
MENIRIGTRPLHGFGAVVVLTVLLGLFTMQRYSVLQSLSENLNDRDFAALRSIQALDRSEYQMRATRASALLAGFLRRDRLPAASPESIQRR